MNYPVDRLAQAMGTSVNAALERLGVGGSTGLGYRRNGMSWRVADRLAVKAGFHPATVWPEWIDDAISDLGVDCAECGQSFTPKMHTQRFCSRHCYHRHHARRTARRRRERPEEAEKNRARRRRYYAANREYELARQSAYDRERRQKKGAA